MTWSRRCLNSDGHGRKADRGGAALQRDLPASEKAGTGADALPVRAGMRALLSDVFSVFFAHSGLFPPAAGADRPVRHCIRAAFQNSRHWTAGADGRNDLPGQRPAGACAGRRDLLRLYQLLSCAAAFGNGAFFAANDDRRLICGAA